MEFDSSFLKTVEDSEFWIPEITQKVVTPNKRAKFDSSFDLNCQISTRLHEKPQFQIGFNPKSYQRVRFDCFCPVFSAILSMADWDRSPAGAPIHVPPSTQRKQTIPKNCQKSRILDP